MILPSSVSTKELTNDATNNDYDTFYNNLWDLDIYKMIENETISDINAKIKEMENNILSKSTKDKEYMNIKNILDRIQFYPI